MLILHFSASEGTGALRSGILQVVALGDPAVCMDVDAAEMAIPTQVAGKMRRADGEELATVRVWRFSTLPASKSAHGDIARTARRERTEGVQRVMGGARGR